MSKIYTTEITSGSIPSDNPVHQRLYKAYVVARDYVYGNVLEVGCGEGRGVELLMEKTHHFTAIDKISSAIEILQKKFPNGTFISGNLPPLKELDDNLFDSVVSFQVIEHINDDHLFLKEIHRVLKPGGIALITTPNRKMSLTRNPWHIREYLPEELSKIARLYFDQVEMKGISGNEKVMKYYEENRQSVQRVARWDIFNLQYTLPASILRIPYELLNRWNRNKLKLSNNTLVTEIHHSDYITVDNAADALDLFLLVRK